MNLMYHDEYLLGSLICKFDTNIKVLICLSFCLAVLWYTALQA